MWWYIVAVKAGAEETIAERLCKLPGIEEVYYPKRMVWRQHKKKGENVKRQPRWYPLIPGYLCLFANLDRVGVGNIRNYEGVYSFLGSGGRPMEVSGSDILELKRCEAHGDYDEGTAIFDRMIIGSTVILNDGPFVGKPAIIRKKTEKTIVVEISLFGHATLVQIALDSFKAIA